MTLLLTGASGRLGAYLLRELRDSGLPVVAWGNTWTGTLFGIPIQSVDLTQRDRVVEAFQQARPRWVIHTAALSSVAECHRHPELAWTINVESTRLLAQLAADSQARLVLTSTDMVFDGTKGNYCETDPASPLSHYGRSKLAGEQEVLAFPATVVARVSLLFGPALLAVRPGFFDQQVSSLQAGQPITCFVDEWRTPVSYPTAARALLALADSEFHGLIHVGGPKRLSRLEMGLLLARRLGAPAELVWAAKRHHIPAPEPRPGDASLDASLWRQHFPAQPWPEWDEALHQLGL